VVSIVGMFVGFRSWCAFRPPRGDPRRRERPDREAAFHVVVAKAPPQQTRLPGGAGKLRELTAGP
jgi:hypothetical protein